MPAETNSSPKTFSAGAPARETGPIRHHRLAVTVRTTDTQHHRATIRHHAAEPAGATAHSCPPTVTGGEIPGCVRDLTVTKDSARHGEPNVAVI